MDISSYFKKTTRASNRLFREIGQDATSSGPSVTSTPTASKSNQATQDPFLSPLVSKDKITHSSTLSHEFADKQSDIQHETLGQPSQLDECDLENWGLYPTVLRWYQSKGITRMFEWQKECLKSEGVLAGKNLVFSAPTSAGKTMVGDILLMKQVFENRKKVLFILPLVSVVREKMLVLQSMLRETHIKVGGFMGNHHTVGGFDGVDVAICTFEKANNYIVRLIAEKRLDVLGGIIVDEAHSISESDRGYILELLLSKVITCIKKDNLNIQIVAMSATLPNLSSLGEWLDASLYQTDYRPVELHETIKLDRQIYDVKTMKLVFTIAENMCRDLRHDSVYLTIKKLLEQRSVLIFYNDKAKCEQLAKDISTQIQDVGSKEGPSSQRLREVITTESVTQVLNQLSACPIRADDILVNCVKFGVAYHHAGLCIEHREIVENAFRLGWLKVLVATSTLSSGVNLPARVVIVKSPVGFNGAMMDPLMYRQMIGRAGRKGLDEIGESILLCNGPNEVEKGKQLINSQPKPMRSRLFDALTSSATPSLQRAILECIVTQLATTDEDVTLFLSSTFHHASASSEERTRFLEQKKDVIDFLLKFDFIKEVNDEEVINYEATQLGKGCIAAAMPPEEGLKLLTVLKQARKGLVLNCDLHLLFLIIPDNIVRNTRFKIETLQYIVKGWKTTNVLEYYTDTMNVLGLSYEKIFHMHHDSQLDFKTIKFFIACILKDIINEIPLHDLDLKYGIHKSRLQSLQANASAFANMVSSFCNKLGWHNIEILLTHLQTRLEFGVQRELIDLMRITCLNSKIARLLYETNLDTVNQIARAPMDKIVKAVSSAKVYVSNSPGRDNTSLREKIWVEARKEMLTFHEFAALIQNEAREIIESDTGVSINWEGSSQESASSEADAETFKTPKKRKRTGKSKNIKTAKDYRYSLTSYDSHQESIMDATKSVLLGEHSICQNPVTPESSPMTNKARKSIIVTAEEEANVPLSPHETIRASLVNNGQSEATQESSQECSQVKQQDNSTDALGIPEMNSADDLLCLNLPPMETPNEKEKHPIPIQSKAIARSVTESIDFGSDFSSTAFKSIIETNEIESSKGQMSVSSAEWQEEEDEARDQVDEISFSTVGSSAITDKRQLSGSIDTSLHVKKKVCQHPISSIDSEKPELISPEDKVQVIECEDSSPQQIVNKWLLWKRISIYFEFTDVNQPTSVIGLKMGAPLPSSSKCELISFDGKKLEAVFLSFGDKNVYRFTDTKAINALADSFRSTLEDGKDLELVVVDVLQTYKALRVCFGLPANLLHKASWLDIKIAYWLESPESLIPHFPMDYVSRYLKLEDKFTSLQKKGKIEYLKALSTSLMVKIFSEQEKSVLNQGRMLFAYEKIEMKAALTLAESQLHGFSVDWEYLNQLSVKLTKLEAELEKKAHQVAQTTFNLTSTKQVAEILYYKLNLLSSACDVIDSNPSRINKIKASKKLPEHLATKKSVLQKLAKRHELPKIICDYRSVENALTRTISPIRTAANKSNKVTGSLDFYTATGRVSMSNPDLMKTPKTFTVNDQVINVRKLLTAATGFTLVSADYSQLEMRVLAHLSNDTQLIDSLNSGTDVFRELAARIYTLFTDDVTEEQRQQAKGICYGIVYGMGKRELSSRLGVSEEEAVEIKDTFLKTLKDINPFITKITEECKANGYIETIGGRRRYLPDISSHKNDEVSKATRQAINSTIQGSAADLAKTAMAKVDAAIEKAKIEAYLTLEMHDELIYQVKCESVRAFAKILSECMQQVTHDSFPDFKVKLPVNLKTGPNWGEMSALHPDPPSSSSSNQPSTDD